MKGEGTDILVSDFQLRGHIDDARKSRSGPARWVAHWAMEMDRESPRLEASSTSRESSKESANARIVFFAMERETGNYE